MSITVKRLIAELDKIENQSIPVEICLLDKASLEPEISVIRQFKGKVLIYLERKK